MLFVFMSLLYSGSVNLHCSRRCCVASAGAIPIPGARNAEQAKEQVGALGWSLDNNEVAIIQEKLEALKL